MTTARFILPRTQFDHWLTILSGEGYTVIGPTLRGDAIILDEITTAADLPVGVRDEQKPGYYRVSQGVGEALFDFAVGPQSWKKYLFPPQQRLWQAKRDASGFSFIPETQSAPPLALLGVRPCDLRALQIQERVFVGGKYVAATYAERLAKALIVVVQCGAPSACCFCTSMGAGPEAQAGFDLALTEVCNDAEHYFVMRSGSARGVELLEKLGLLVATADEQAAAAVIEQAVQKMTGRLNTQDLPELLARNLENPHWEKVAARCESCANCTLVCPTCFCSTVTDTTDLAGTNAERWRYWDSCFTADHSSLHGGSIHQSTGARYRQWLTHKFSTWRQQFGSSGCVGCGRCIAWCPVGIDVTEELASIRETDMALQTNENGRA